MRTPPSTNSDPSHKELHLTNSSRCPQTTPQPNAAAGSVAGCSSFSNLCSSSGCRALLWTRKFKRQKGEARKFCCVAFGSEHARACGGCCSRALCVRRWKLVVQGAGCTSRFCSCLGDATLRSPPTLIPNSTFQNPSQTPPPPAALASTSTVGCARCAALASTAPTAPPGSPAAPERPRSPTPPLLNPSV